MNFSLAKEIYGMNPWCVDQSSFPALISILDNVKNGNNLSLPEEKYNSISVLNLESNEIKLIKDNYELRNSDSFKGIGVINIDGAITVSGGQSSRGMRDVSSNMKQMSKDSRITDFIVVGDSGGGSSMAVKIMSDTISEINKTKPVYGIVREGGMMASACFGIMSACKSIYAESEMSTVGSAGTMMQFEGRKANSEHNGVKYIRLYAPESDSKNKGFEDALNKDDYTVITDKMLKPMNDFFLELIESNRPQLKGSSFRNGHTLLAKDAIGTFIDGIMSFSELVALVSSESGKNSQLLNKKESNKSSINIKNQKMTKAAFKTANPDAYNEIVAEGVAAEKDRVQSWMAHVETDSKAVAKGIESGENISQSAREGFFVKQNTQRALGQMEQGSAPDLKTIESKNPKEIINKELEAEVEAAFDFKLQ